MQLRKAYFRSLVHPSAKLWPKPNSGNSVSCILPCKTGGSGNLMKGRYLSKTPFVTFVYLSKNNISLPWIFGNYKKRFLCTGLMDSQGKQGYPSTPSIQPPFCSQAYNYIMPYIYITIALQPYSKICHSLSNVSSVGSVSSLQHCTTLISHGIFSSKITFPKL